jgi:phosphatidylglycerol lysyltransferase
MAPGTSDLPTDPAPGPRGLAVVGPPPEVDGRRLAHCIEVHGRSSVSPFLDERPNVCFPAGAGVAAYRPVRRWAVFPTGPVAPAGAEATAIDAALARARAEGLSPVFAAVPDPEPYVARGLYAVEIADDPLVSLPGFTLDGKRRASIRHSVSAAARAGLRVVTYTDDHYEGLARVSGAWLRTKRGGELGFTLGRFGGEHLRRVECRVALDAGDQVAGFVTWRRFDDGRGRVLDLMRRAHDAPNPTMDLLVASSLAEFAAAGVPVASLGSVPRGHGALGERVYATTSLRRYKAKFDPVWMPMWLVVPSPSRLPGALRALARAYCEGGVLGALRRNG